MKKIIALTGATASGKTDLAFYLSDIMKNLSIISIDSALIYKNMNIGTAKPTKLELQNYPHYLVDIIEPYKNYSVANCIDDVNLLSDKIFSKNKVPFLVGGTMMYFNGLINGISKLPDRDEKIRLKILEKANLKGWDYLYEELKTVDFESYNKIKRQDIQRIQRCLEVYYLTGTTISTLQKNENNTKKLNYDVNLIALFPQDRSILHKRIEQRFLNIVHNGFLDEVKFLKSHYNLSLDSPSMKCVGYKQAFLYLENKLTYDEFIEKSIIATRQLAKRQLTWLRNWKGKILYIDPFNTKNIDLYKKINNYLL